MTQRVRLIIATRRSELALWQANHVARLLHERHPGLKVELLPLTTEGDRILERDEEQRAYAAYFRFAKGHPVDQLAAALSGMAKYKGLEYVVLRDGSRTLAVYRIRKDGHLHRLKRWPAALD